MIDHLVYATPDVGATVAELERSLGVRAAPGGRHEGRGTHNALLGLGDETYLEIIGPDPEQPDPASPRPFAVDELEGARLVTWAARVDGIDAVVERARGAGYDPGPVMSMSRRRLDGELLEWRLTFPPPSGDGLVPFLIDWGETVHPAATAPAGVVLRELWAEHPDPVPARKAIAALGLELRVEPGSQPRLIAELDAPKRRVELT